MKVVLMLLIIIFLPIIAQLKIKGTYNKYMKVKNESELTGAEAAKMILKKNGLSNVNVYETSGTLTDYYDPKKKMVVLSSDIYNSKSVSSVAVAAHECGHAIQDKEGYFFLRLRANLVPIVNISSKLGYFAILIGLIFGFLNLAWIGIFLELAILLFQLITLPVEFNASKRANEFLNKEALIEKTEQEGSKSMLNAAAMTYVASVISTILEIFRLILIVASRDDR